MEKKIYIILFFNLILLILCLVMTTMLLFFVKCNNTDVNKDGITDIRDLVIVQKKIIEREQ